MSRIDLNRIEKSSGNNKTICKAKIVLTTNPGIEISRDIPTCLTPKQLASSSLLLHCSSVMHCCRTHDALAKHYQMQQQQSLHLSMMKLQTVWRLANKIHSKRQWKKAKDVDLDVVHQLYITLVSSTVFKLFRELKIIPLPNANFRKMSMYKMHNKTSMFD